VSQPLLEQTVALIEDDIRVRGVGGKQREIRGRGEREREGRKGEQDLIVKMKD